MTASVKLHQEWKCLCFLENSYFADNENFLTTLQFVFDLWQTKWNKWHSVQWRIPKEPQNPRYVLSFVHMQKCPIRYHCFFFFSFWINVMFLSTLGSCSTCTVQLYTQTSSFLAQCGFPTLRYSNSGLLYRARWNDIFNIHRRNWRTWSIRGILNTWVLKWVPIFAGNPTFVVEKNNVPSSWVCEGLNPELMGLLIVMKVGVKKRSLLNC